MQGGQGKGSGLAGAGLGQTHDVMSFKDKRYGLGLNGGWRCIATEFDAGDKSLVKGKRSKSHNNLRVKGNKDDGARQRSCPGNRMYVLGGSGTWSKS
ncbi:hypothetical protein PSDVSF_30480 [Pseudodesulfovibrio sediminis]|uniref:Uncharacterized protein n=1 Tax=Pseudodesulfovibrio sediminis TaxID=2810563 RepID=A0ABM7P9Y0_9BACT|nr:hypothetical protein PSDVSF_30480 [Pseudodesulfovibrio sediminis]